MKREHMVLDERELMEMYHVEHIGLWVILAMLCGALLFQCLLGAPLLQMAGEAVVLAVGCCVMIAGYARRGIWDTASRPSMRGNLSISLVSALVVGAVACVRRGLLVGAVVGVLMLVLCFSLLTAFMRLMRERQRKREAELEDEE